VDTTPNPRHSSKPGSTDDRHREALDGCDGRSWPAVATRWPARLAGGPACLAGERRSRRGSVDRGLAPVYGNGVEHLPRLARRQPPTTAVPTAPQPRTTPRQPGPSSISMCGISTFPNSAPPARPAHTATSPHRQPRTRQRPQTQHAPATAQPLVPGLDQQRQLGVAVRAAHTLRPRRPRHRARGPATQRPRPNQSWSRAPANRPQN
jgi:hypothetical protein